MTGDEQVARLEREKVERAKMPVQDGTKEVERLQREKKSRGAISGYGVPRPTVLPPPRKVPEDLPISISQWLGETK